MLDTTHNPPRIILPDKSFFEILPIPPGSFLMGSKDEEAWDDEKIVHRVNIGYSFFMSKYPVTQALWLAVMGEENGSYFKGLTRPTDSVSWYDAAVFCNRLSKWCGVPPVYFSDKNYRKPFGKEGENYFLPNDGEVFINQKSKGIRLPGEAEWEYAARGGSAGGASIAPEVGQAGSAPGFKYSGGNKLDEVGWYSENSHGETKPVELKLPNSLGLHDMSGNVWEWCNDHWHGSYEGTPGDGSPWLDPKGVNRIRRGGSWGSNPHYCPVSYRNHYRPGGRIILIGFRLVLVSLPV